MTFVGAWAVRTLPANGACQPARVGAVVVCSNGTNCRCALSPLRHAQALAWLMIFEKRGESPSFLPSDRFGIALALTRSSPVTATGNSLDRPGRATTLKLTVLGQDDITELGKGCSASSCGSTADQLAIFPSRFAAACSIIPAIRSRPPSLRAHARGRGAGLQHPVPLLQPEVRLRQRIAARGGVRAADSRQAVKKTIAVAATFLR